MQVQHSAAVPSYAFGHILMHIYKSREDMSDDTGKVYVQLWEEKKILSRQKVSKVLNT